MNDEPITATRGDGDDGNRVSHYLWHLSRPWRGVRVIDVGYSRTTREAQVWVRAECVKRATADSEVEALEMLGFHPLTTPLQGPAAADVDTSCRTVQKLHRYFQNEAKAARKDHDSKRAAELAELWQELLGVQQHVADLRSLRGKPSLQDDPGSEKNEDAYRPEE